MTTPDHTIVQLTDTHLSTPGDLVHGVMDTTSNLRAVLAHLDATDQNVDAIVLSGDLADAGKASAYELLRSMVEPTAARLGATLCYAVGNHDDRASFRAGLGLHDVGPNDVGRPYDVVQSVGGLRIITLDSSSPGRHDGSLEAEQLDWLAEQLRDRTPRGTILVLHHPPIHSPVCTVDFLRLTDPDALESVLIGSDVRMILCGHAHHTGASAIAGIPVWLGPPISHRTDAMPPAGRHRAGVGFGFSRIDVFGRSVVATAVDVVGARDVYSEPRSVAMERLWSLTPLDR